MDHHLSEEFINAKLQVQKKFHCFQLKYPKNRYCPDIEAVDSIQELKMIEDMINYLTHKQEMNWGRKIGRQIFQELNLDNQLQKCYPSPTQIN